MALGVPSANDNERESHEANGGHPTREEVEAEMKAHHGFAAVLVAGALVLGASAQDRTGRAKGEGAFYGTPQDVFKVAAKALRTNDWRTFSSCLTPTSRDEFAGGMLFSLAQQKGALEKAPPETRARLQKQLKPLDDLLARYGITEEKMRDFPRPTAAAGPKDLAAQKRLMRQLSTTLLKDRSAFIADFMAAERKVAESMGKKKPGDFDPGKLVDLKVRGDTATGAALARQGGKEVRVPMRFHKGANGWRMDIPQRRPMNVKAPGKAPAAPGGASER